MAKIELRQLVGTEKRRGVRVPTSRPIRRVFIDGQYVGIVAEAPGSKFLPSRRDLTDDEVSNVLKAVEVLHGIPASASPGAAVDAVGQQDADSEDQDPEPPQAETLSFEFEPKEPGAPPVVVDTDADADQQDGPGVEDSETEAE